MTNRQKILTKLRTEKLATISTVDPTSLRPEAALVAFAEDKNLYIYVQTSLHSRKFRNLIHNCQAALVIGFDYVTVQYEGRAELVEDQDEIQRIILMFKTKESPSSPDYFKKSDTRIFKISPTWIGYSDYTSETPEVFELSPKGIFNL